MRLPLFVAAKPTVGMKSPSVLLRPGTWKLSCDSDVVLSLNGVVREEVTSLELFDVVAEIMSVGKSSSLTAYLDNGTD